MAYTVCQCMPCSGTCDVIDVTVELRVHIDDKLTSCRRHPAKKLNTTAGNSIITAMVIDLLCHLTYSSIGTWNTVYATLLSTYK